MYFCLVYMNTMGKILSPVEMGGCSHHLRPSPFTDVLLTVEESRAVSLLKKNKNNFREQKFRLSGRVRVINPNIKASTLPKNNPNTSQVTKAIISRTQLRSNCSWVTLLRTTTFGTRTLLLVGMSHCSNFQGSLSNYWWRGAEMIFTQTSFSTARPGKSADWKHETVYQRSTLWRRQVSTRFMMNACVWMCQNFGIFKGSLWCLFDCIFILPLVSNTVGIDCVVS